MSGNQSHEGLVVVRGAADGFVQEVIAGAHQLRCDEPTSAGGTDTGPTPYDLLLAALGACTSMTLAMYARRKKWPLEHVTVRLRHSREYAQDSARCETQDRDSRSSIGRSNWTDRSTMNAPDYWRSRTVARFISH